MNADELAEKWNPILDKMVKESQDGLRVMATLIFEVAAKKANNLSNFIGWKNENHST